MGKKHTQVRKRPPRFKNTAEGIEIHCPYCHPSHVIRPDMKTNCGTILEIYAVQALYEDIKCILCGSTAGQLVKVGKLYKHPFNCQQNKKLLTEMPETSKSAALAYRLPKRVQSGILRITGKRAHKLVENEKELGYYWDV